jgi:HSP20 family protein
MPTLHQLREDMTQAWDRVFDGWGHLYRRATGALTRFTPGMRRDASEETDRR